MVMICMEIAVVERWGRKRFAARILAGGDFEGAVKPLIET